MRRATWPAVCAHCGRSFSADSLDVAGLRSVARIYRAVSAHERLLAALALHDVALLDVPLCRFCSESVFQPAWLPLSPVDARRLEARRAARRCGRNIQRWKASRWSRRPVYQWRPLRFPLRARP